MTAQYKERLESLFPLKSDIFFIGQLRFNDSKVKEYLKLLKFCLNNILLVRPFFFTFFEKSKEIGNLPKLKLRTTRNYN